MASSHKKILSRFPMSNGFLVYVNCKYTMYVHVKAGTYICV